ncbi:electron transport complex subunit RsxC [Marinobacterium iners]|uniref:Ion-translocating oxidoreductase complex subunit C n=1 Tax=Marinobacterium iners DSM 11526 TaxID=1122198 RepID=A0A1H4FJX1_9GAMM|nr:electron transport complex subunit RsxC [Marinobacterium iners]SEA97604.1 electron transport complex protein RnfC [Marinobacterium iners DSM 11526]
MGKVFAFHGGVHPPENKKQSTRTPIAHAPLPKMLYIPLQQHIGIAANPVVNVGDRVLKGQLIAEPVGRISASLHAPTSGIVRSIGPHPVPHASGLESDCITLETDGQNEWIEHQGLQDYTRLEPSVLIEHIRQCGIAGMGGAGFPTDVKLHLGDDHIVNTLIINAAECEPYITADDMLMRERAADILSGIRIISHLLRPSHIMIGIEDNKPQAIHALEAVLKGCELNVDIRVVPTKYPSGGERQLIQLLTGLEVPSGRIPADIGIVCQNVGTATAIHRAVHFGEPLISRIVTVTGDAVAKPQNFEALIGTPFADLLEAASLYEGRLFRLVMGGPMMGVTVAHDQIPVIKTTNCIIAASDEEMPQAPPEQPCIRCNMCEQVCPVTLLPQQLYWFSKGREFDKARNHNLFDCIECGACAYVCPSSIPLVQYYRFAKSEIRTEEAEQRKADHARQRFEARQARLEREQAEKEARRKARAEEAARAQQSRKSTEADKAQAEPGNAAPAASAAPDLKQLKTAAAVARTKLKKARDALKNAEDKGLDGIDALRVTLTDLEQKSEEAEQAFKAAEQAEAAAAAEKGVDLKQLKIDAAMARAAVTKLERALTKTEDEQARREMETELVEARKKSDALNQSLSEHSPA